MAILNLKNERGAEGYYTYGSRKYIVLFGEVEICVMDLETRGTMYISAEVFYNNSNFIPFTEDNFDEITEFTGIEVEDVTSGKRCRVLSTDIATYSNITTINYHEEDNPDETLTLPFKEFIVRHKKTPHCPTNKGD